MNVTEVRAEYRRTVSDGNYGNEQIGVTYTATLDGDDLVQECTVRLTDAARAWVLAKLHESTSETIRRAVETPEERQEREAQQEAEYAARRQRQAADAAARDALRAAVAAKVAADTDLTHFWAEDATQAIVERYRERQREYDERHAARREDEEADPLAAPDEDEEDDEDEHLS